MHIIAFMEVAFLKKLTTQEQSPHMTPQKEFFSPITSRHHRIHISFIKEQFGTVHCCDQLSINTIRIY